MQAVELVGRIKISIFSNRELQGTSLCVSLFCVFQAKNQTTYYLVV